MGERLEGLQRAEVDLQESPIHGGGQEETPEGAGSEKIENPEEGHHA